MAPLKRTEHALKKAEETHRLALQTINRNIEAERARLLHELKLKHEALVQKEERNYAAVRQAIQDEEKVPSVTFISPPQASRSSLNNTGLMIKAATRSGLPFATILRQKVRSASCPKLLQLTPEGGMRSMPEPNSPKSPQTPARISVKPVLSHQQTMPMDWATRIAFAQAQQRSNFFILKGLDVPLQGGALAQDKGTGGTAGDAHSGEFVVARQRGGSGEVKTETAPIEVKADAAGLPEATPSLSRAKDEAKDEEADVQKQLPGNQEILERLFGNGSEGFSEKSMERISRAFSRFKVPGEADLHIDDIGELLHYLGHVLTAPEQLTPIIKEVTMYDYVDEGEFMTFLNKYIEWELSMFRKVFMEFDTEGVGEVSVAQLRKLMSTLGFTPLKVMVEEALRAVDENGNGMLDFDELCTFLAVYQYTEGFNLEEVSRLRDSFERFAESANDDSKQLLLKPADLSDALVRVFGLAAAEHAMVFGEQLRSGQGLSKSSFAVNHDEPESLPFSDFLTFARKIREAQWNKLTRDFPQWAPKGHGAGEAPLTNHFALADTDRSGGISEKELRKVIRGMGFTPLKQVMDEVLKQVIDGELVEEKEMDFVEFFDFVRIYSEWDGFRRSEVEAMTRVFERFDKENHGEVSVLELSDMLRHLGHRVCMDDIRDLVQQVDANGSGAVDIREFLGLMRLFREKDLQNVQRVFDQFKDRETGLLPGMSLNKTLSALGHDAAPLLVKQQITFDTFVEYVDAERAAFVKKEMKKCGFTEAEIEHFQHLFDGFDKDKSGDIDVMELMVILKEFGWQPKTKEDQEILMKRIEEARLLSQEARAEDDSEEPEDPNAITFWVFVRLVRIYKSEADAAEQRHMVQLQKELGFSGGEIEQFRQIYRNAIMRCVKEAAEAEGRDQSEVTSRDLLPGHAARRLIRSLGVTLSAQDMADLDRKMSTFDREGRNENCEIDFESFLRVMKWVLNTDFGGVRSATARAARGA